MPEKDLGLFGKYHVTRNDGKPLGDCFVLEYGRDPFAIAALMGYITALDGHPKFANLQADLMDIVSAVGEKGMRCRLDCPKCDHKHVDGEDEGPHHIHFCGNCGHDWQPFAFKTAGIAR